MIRLVPYRAHYFDRQIDEWLNEGFSISKKYYSPDADRYAIYDRNLVIGMAGIIKNGDIASFQYFIGYEKDRHLKKGRATVAVITNMLIRNKFKIIQTETNNNHDYIQTLKHNLYFEKGKVYQRMVEPYRSLIPDRAFDEQGYIINQGLFDQVPFGHFKSREKGCGFIAVYNLLKLYGEEKTLQEVCEDISKKAIFGGIIGANVFNMKTYLNKQGLPVKLYRTSKKGLKKKMANTSMGIIMYFHKKGGHYVAYNSTPVKNRYRFFNVTYGKRLDFQNIDSFIKNFVFLPVCIVIGVEK